MKHLLTAIAITTVLLVPCWAMVGADDGAPPPVVRVEAEDYADMHGIRVIERAEASRGLTVSYWEDPGSWLDLEFDLPVAGEYLISIRYALNWPDTDRVVLLDGEELGEIELQTTGSWGDFDKITLPFEPLELPAGKVTLRFLNRDSRGLSLDRVAMHHPDAPLADHPLSSEEREKLHRRVTETVGPYARRVLHYGEVEFHAVHAGGPAWAKVSGHLLVAGGLPEEDRGTLMRRRTEYHQVALLDGGAGGSGLLIAITDGTSLHLVALADEASAIPLPAPVLGADGIRIVTARAGESGDLHLPAGEWQERTEYLKARGLHITAAPMMLARPWDERGLEPRLALETTDTDAGHVGVARFSPRWGTEEPRVGLMTDGAYCVVQETTVRNPTLAAFYDEGMFDLRLAPNGEIAFKDVRSGETVVLREERGSRPETR